MFNRRDEIPWGPLDTVKKALDLIEKSDPSKKVAAIESCYGEIDLFIEGKKWKYISDGENTGYFVPERLDLLAQTGYPELSASVAVSGYGMSPLIEKLYFTLAKGEESKLAASILKAREMWDVVVKDLTALIETRDQETETLRAWSKAVEQAGIMKKKNGPGPYPIIDPKWRRVITHVLGPGINLDLAEDGRWRIDGFLTTEQHAICAEVVDRAYRSVH